MRTSGRVVATGAPVEVCEFHRPGTGPGLFFPGGKKTGKDRANLRRPTAAPQNGSRERAKGPGRAGAICAAAGGAQATRASFSKKGRPRQGRPHHGRAHTRPGRPRPPKGGSRGRPGPHTHQAPGPRGSGWRGRAAPSAPSRPRPTVLKAGAADSRAACRTGSAEPGRGVMASGTKCPRAVAVSTGDAVPASVTAGLCPAARAGMQQPTRPKAYGRGGGRFSQGCAPPPT